MNLRNILHLRNIEQLLYRIGSTFSKHFFATIGGTEERFNIPRGIIQGCYRYFLKVSPIFDIDAGIAGFKSIVDTDIDTLP